MEIWYRLDRLDRISALSDGFEQFARENGGPTPAAILGRSLWDFVAGDELRAILGLLLQRSQQHSIRVPMRCDSPQELRLLEMSVDPPLSPNAERQVWFRELSTQTPAPLAEADPESLQTLCSWCNTFETDQGWLPVERAAGLLGLLSQRARPITHGICPRCVAGFETENFNHLQPFESGERIP